MRNNALFSNLEIVDKRFPTLAQKILSLNSVDIEVTNAQDNGHCYAVRTETGQWAPITNPIDPIAKATQAVNSMESRLLNGMSPALIVGLAPGYELEIIYNHFKEQHKKHGFPFRRIYVLIHSAASLIAWLKAQDRSEVLNNDKVEFYWHSETPSIIKLCKEDWKRSHHFIPMTSLDDATSTKILKAIEQFYLARRQESQEILTELQNYYSNITDQELELILENKAGRPPRLMMPTHSASTVVQYSTRDTLDLFETEGWQAKAIKADTEITHWSMLKQLQEFKPDLVISINHLRTEEKEQCYPDNLMFITWIQDSMATINNSKVAQEWNKMLEDKELERDKIIGYVDQIRKYAYQEDRLNECQMIVNPKIFKKYELTEEELEKYSCDICFASNSSKTTAEIIDEELAPALKKYGITHSILTEIDSLLWKHYRAEKTCTSYQELYGVISSVEDFKFIYTSLDKDQQDEVLQKLYWRLNDTIYRHIILEWIVQDGEIKLNLYGKGWEKHPRFHKYAKGTIQHGPELAKAYQAAKYCLHLNSMEGGHQRLYEIINSQSAIISRRKTFSQNRNKALIHLVEGTSPEDSISQNHMEEEIFHRASSLYYQTKAMPANIEETGASILKDYRLHSLKFDKFITHFDSQEQVLETLREAPQEVVYKEHRQINEFFSHDSSSIQLSEQSLSIIKYIYSDSTKSPLKTSTEFANVLKAIELISSGQDNKALSMVKEINPSQLHHHSSHKLYSKLMAYFTDSLEHYEVLNSHWHIIELLRFNHQNEAKEQFKKLNFKNDYLAEISNYNLFRELPKKQNQSNKYTYPIFLIGSQRYEEAHSFFQEKKAEKDFWYHFYEVILLFTEKKYHLVEDKISEYSELQIYQETPYSWSALLFYARFMFFREKPEVAEKLCQFSTKSPYFSKENICLTFSEIFLNPKTLKQDALNHCYAKRLFQASLIKTFNCSLTLWEKTLSSEDINPPCDSIFKELEAFEINYLQERYLS
mgnify:CR=1 FL=1